MGPFVPMLFQGEEWAASSPFQYFANHEDPRMARAVSEGRKREFAAFGWNPALIPDPEKRETFERSKLKWDEVEDPSHAEMRSWYRELIRLRRATPRLNDSAPGGTRVSFDDREQWLRMDHGAIGVLCNLAPSQRSFELSSSVQFLLASGPGVALNGNIVQLPPDSVAIFTDPVSRHADARGR
jgi:maltooligosyltrehalose trehalohydrolase